MTSAEDLLDALNCTIHFTTPEGDYEGVLKQVFVPSRIITVGKILFLPSQTKFGTLSFMFHEISSIKILHRPDISNKNANETSLIYFRSDIEKMFDLDGCSETESECQEDKESNEEFVMRLLPCFSKLIPTDSQIIDSFNSKFSLAIKFISKENLIGVSLEGPKISRNGIPTWLCISTSLCTYLFDILALGKKSFENGLKSILENSKIKKIFHDCRLVSDCLFHMYNVRLVNVFDTQVADSLVMMQENKNCSIINRVNSLDACLSYYLQMPDEYLYSPLTFSLDKQSTNYHGLRPLCHSFRGAMIKNVIYLQLLKRELETAMLTPLRRATEVYLNVIQNATDRELMVAPPVLDELPPELLLEGIQIVRYQQHEYIPSIVSSGPPYRKLVNPIKDYVDCCKQLRTKQKEYLPSEKEIISQIGEGSKFPQLNISNEACKRDGEFGCIKQSFKNKMLQDISIRKMTNQSQSVLGDLSLNMEQNSENDHAKVFIDPFSQVNDKQSNKHAVGNASIADLQSSSKLNLMERHVNEIAKDSFIYENPNLAENKSKVPNPVDNCLLRSSYLMPCEKKLESIKTSSISSELLNGNSTTLGKDERLNVQTTFNANCEDLWNKIRKEYATQQSGCDHTPKIRFVPAGMAAI